VFSVNYLKWIQVSTNKISTLSKYALQFFKFQSFRIIQRVHDRVLVVRPVRDFGGASRLPSSGLEDKKESISEQVDI
jgi:hypothetical protein